MDGIMSSDDSGFERFDGYLGTVVFECLFLG